MEGRLLVDGGDVGRLALGSGEEVTLDVELETCIMRRRRHQCPCRNALVNNDNGPLATWFSSSIWVLRTFEVVQVWVKVTPFLASTYLPSRSPAIAFDLASRVPATRNATLLGARVCLSNPIASDDQFHFPSTFLISSGARGWDNDGGDLDDACFREVRNSSNPTVQSPNPVPPDSASVEVQCRTRASRRKLSRTGVSRIATARGGDN